ncbi:MAG: hypothetical protein JW915_12320 [Chitinispirillaceae bacterium]|nr:hypothetical protein [Chitinispirillaceae bacterium]
MKTPYWLLIPLCAGFYQLCAELPADLPGEEITQEYMKWVLPKDTVLTGTVNNKDQLSATWYDKAAKTWDSPPLSEQMASVRAHIPLGKGGIFVPKFSDLYRTPEIEILDPEGDVVTSGAMGNTFSVEAGTYFVVIGSGSHRQRLVRQVVVEESKATPVLPEWSGLTIETLDSNSVPFRGEYEIVRIDEFEPYGRGFGADPTIGEALTTWILKPGTYKIFGRGQSFNALKNFVTVRLLPGEYTKFLLIQRPDDYTIIGGGTLDLSPGTKLKSNWRYGANVGGTLFFSGKIDNNESKNDAMNLNLNVRSNFWLSYNKAPYEWISDLLIDEGINVSDLDFFSKLDFKEFSNATDELRITSLFIWRVLQWFGPYGRTEISTNLFPRRMKREDKLFYLLNTDSSQSGTIDSSSTFKLSNSLSPLMLEIGAGANFDIIRMRMFETKVRLGVGSTMGNFPDKYEVISSDNDSLNNFILLQQKEKTTNVEFGPQAALSTSLHIGRFAIASAELKMFTPVVPEMRITRPDFDLQTTLSWRLSRFITLDYDYRYILVQPDNIDARVNTSTHRIWLRFSYSSR